jgi:hypothetical protein
VIAADLVSADAEAARLREYVAFGILDILVPLLILSLVILGSQDTCDRIFRLLRWAANRPEPPGPELERTTRVRAIRRCP